MTTVAPIAGLVIASAVFAGLAAAQDLRPAGALQGLSFTSRGEGRIYVTERGGAVSILDQDGSVNQTPFLNVPTADLLALDLELSDHVIYSIAFHPNFEENGHVFAHYAPQPFNGQSVIVRFTADTNSPNAISAKRARETAEVVLRIEDSPIRQVGSIGFTADGWLSLSHPLGRRRLLGPEDVGLQ